MKKKVNFISAVLCEVFFYYYPQYNITPKNQLPLDFSLNVLHTLTGHFVKLSCLTV